MSVFTRPIRQLKHTQKLASSGFSVVLRLNLVDIGEKNIYIEAVEAQEFAILSSKKFLCWRIGRVNQILQLSPLLGTVLRKDYSRSLSASFFLSFFTLSTYFFYISMNDLNLTIYGIGRGLQLGDSVDFSTFLHQRVSYQWLVFPHFCQQVHLTTGLLCQCVCQTRLQNWS